MRIGLALILSTLALACGGDDGDTATVGEGSTGDPGTDATTMTTSTTATTMDATTDATMTTAGSASMTATTDPTSDTTDPGTSTDPSDTGPSDTTGSASDPCEIGPEDSECDTCVKKACCDQLTACEADPECVCFQDCAGSMKPSLEIPQVCGDMCGIETPFAHPTVGQVLSCSAGCTGSCL